jgi:hypothetical protein
VKACPHCAEDIQDAAVVCKHCRRELIAPKRKTRGSTWLALAIIVGMSGCAATWYFGQDHQDFLTFTQERQRWHVRCDQYINKAEPDMPRNEVAAFRQCAADLNRMMATAKERGWAKSPP